jgi:fluoride exporter
VSLGLALAIALGGSLGAPMRYLVDRAVSTRVDSEFPWGTMAINVTGCLIYGVIAGLFLHHHIGGVLVAMVGTGFCGAFTTFSTFTTETVRLVIDEKRGAALVNVAGATVAGLAAAGAGLVIGLHA